MPSVEPPEGAAFGHRLDPVRPMRVVDLIAILQESTAPEDVVHLYSDAEGNDCHPLLEVETGENWVALVPYD